MLRTERHDAECHAPHPLRRTPSTLPRLPGGGPVNEASREILRPPVRLAVEQPGPHAIPWDRQFRAEPATRATIQSILHPAARLPLRLPLTLLRPAAREWRETGTSTTRKPLRIALICISTVHP